MGPDFVIPAFIVVMTVVGVYAACSTRMWDSNDENGGTVDQTGLAYASAASKPPTRGPLSTPTCKPPVYLDYMTNYVSGEFLAGNRDHLSGITGWGRYRGI